MASGTTTPICPRQEMLYASEVATAVGGKLDGEDRRILSAQPVNALQEGALSFATGAKYLVAEHRAAVLLVPENYPALPGNTYIKVRDPRLAFAQALTRFFAPPVVPAIASTAVISQTAELGKEVSIGEHVVIEADVHIGDRTVIQHGAIIHAGVFIAEDCVIGAGAVIGNHGFGYARDDSGIPIAMPHFGSVRIDRDVHVGAGTTIARGTLSDTQIGAHCKIGAQVNIQHNVIVGTACIIASKAQISGSVRIGDHCWLGPNCTIRVAQIGDHATIGIGAVILDNVPAHASMVASRAVSIDMADNAPDLPTATAGQASFEDRLHRLIRSILMLDEQFALLDTQTPDDIPGWDSLRHMDLLLAAQQEFKAKIPLDEMADIRSIGDLQRTLRQYSTGGEAA